MFSTRNNVSYNEATGAVLLQGWSSTGSLAPSAGLLSLEAYVGDVTINATITSYQIVQ